MSAMPPEKRFVVFASPRSGSTWLMDLLARHPRIKGLNELFAPAWFTAMQREPSAAELYGAMQPDLFYSEFVEQSHLPRPLRCFRYLDHVKTLGQGHEALGFKVMYNQLKGEPELLLKLKLDGYRVVHLIRENLLDVIISDEIWRRGRVAHATAALEARTLDYTPAQILELLRKAQRRLRLAARLLSLGRFPTIEVTYDELALDPTTTIGRICAFLGVDPLDRVESPFRKTNRAPHWETLANYDAIREALRCTEFESLLSPRPHA